MLAYVMDKVNQLLTLMGAVPMQPEEFAADTLLERDPLGVVCESIAQMLKHLQHTNEHVTNAHEAVQNILATAGAGILVVDRQMLIQAYNPKFREMLRGHAGDLIGHPCCKVLCHQETPPEHCTFQNITEIKAPFVRRNWTHDSRFYDVSGAPVKDEHGEISRIVLVYQDVTDRRRTEEILVENERMFRRLFELSKDLVLYLAPDGDFLYVNPTCRAMLGRSAEELGVLVIEDIVHPSSREETLRLLKTAAEGSQSLHLSTILVAGDGTSVPVSGVISTNITDDRHIATCAIFRPADR